jgi:hypothetical protein
MPAPVNPDNDLRAVLSGCGASRRGTEVGVVEVACSMFKAVPMCVGIPMILALNFSGCSQENTELRSSSEPSPRAQASTIDGGKYLESPPFIATVLSVTTIELNPDEPHYSAQGPGFRLELKKEDGHVLRVVLPYTDSNWEWAHRLRSVTVGKTYRFAPKAQKHPQLMGE